DASRRAAVGSPERFPRMEFSHVPSLPFALVQETLDLLAGLLTGFLIYAVFYIPISWIWPHPVLKWWWGVVTHTFWRVRPWGVKNIPEPGRATLVSNHVSYLAWMYISPPCPRRVRFLVWPGYRRNPIWRFFLAWGRAIPIESRKPTISNVREAFAKARAALNEGDLVVFFAEGRLTRTGFMRPFHRGLEFVAREANVPIIPARILNA